MWLHKLLCMLGIHYSCITRISVPHYGPQSSLQEYRYTARCICCGKKIRVDRYMIELFFFRSPWRDTKSTLNSDRLDRDFFYSYSSLHRFVEIENEKEKQMGTAERSAINLVLKGSTPFSQGGHTKVVKVRHLPVPLRRVWGTALQLAWNQKKQGG